MALLHMVLLTVWHGVERRSTAAFFKSAADQRQECGAEWRDPATTRPVDTNAKVPATTG